MTTAVQRYQAIVIKEALRLYKDTGMKANRLYTPQNMMAMATKITGKTFKPRDYEGAVNAIKLWLEENE